MEAAPTTNDKRRQLLDLAQGGDGRVRPYIDHLQPPEVIDGHAYEYRVVEDDTSSQDGRRYLYVDTLEQAEKLLHIGDLEV